MAPFYALPDMQHARHYPVYYSMYFVLVASEQAFKWGIFLAAVGLYSGLANILAGSLIEEDALLLTKVPTLHNLKLVSTPTSFSGTFKLETIRNAKGQPLDASFFGLQTPSAWALQQPIDRFEGS